MLILDDLKKMRKYWDLKDEALSLSLWRTRFGTGCGPVIRLRNDDHDDMMRPKLIF
jgi:hypothetical protein